MTGIYDEVVDKEAFENPPLSLAKLFNPTYFSRIFAKKTGRNFNVYLSSLRLDHATHLLETTTSSIPDISEESGFSSSRAFIEMFKKVNELTPKQYRDQCNEHKKVHHSND